MSPGKQKQLCLPSWQDTHRTIWPGYSVPDLLTPINVQRKRKRNECEGESYFQEQTVPTSILMSIFVFGVSSAKRKLTCFTPGYPEEKQERNKVWIQHGMGSAGNFLRKRLWRRPCVFFGNATMNAIPSIRIRQSSLFVKAVASSFSNLTFWLINLTNVWVVMGVVDFKYLNCTFSLAKVHWQSNWSHFVAVHAWNRHSAAVAAAGSGAASSSGARWSDTYKSCLIEQHHDSIYLL